MWHRRGGQGAKKDVGLAGGTEAVGGILLVAIMDDRLSCREGIDAMVDRYWTDHSSVVGVLVSCLCRDKVYTR